MGNKERQVAITDELTKLVGHEHHCYICGDEDNLFLVTTNEGYKGILCEDCIKTQQTDYHVVFVSKTPHQRK